MPVDCVVQVAAGDDGRNEAAGTSLQILYVSIRQNISSSLINLRPKPVQIVKMVERVMI